MQPVLGHVNVGALLALVLAGIHTYKTTKIIMTPCKPFILEKCLKTPQTEYASLIGCNKGNIG